MEPASASLFIRPGNFVVGVNYWASHAGTAMWTDWQPDVVRSDLKQMAEAGLDVLRVFPLWPVFQPLTALRACHGQFVEYRHGENPLPDDDMGKAGISPVAMKHFREFADMAAQANLRLIVSLITGWMSGRLFVPPAFEGMNVLTDPRAIQWQVRFARFFVRTFRKHPAILAWGLGNECNCMGAVTSQEAAWLWTNAIAQAIRSEDAEHPVLSDLHSIVPAVKHVNRQWTIQDQAELTDMLTTHPYPKFTPYCNQEPLDTIRTSLHATAESCLYADIGAKPCIAGELGTLGPMLGSEEVAARYIRAQLFSLWAHDCRGLLWWCAYDQRHLAHAPYDWTALERELGLIRRDRTSKPVLNELGRFVSWRNSLLAFLQKCLPGRTTEAVCLLSHAQDSWGVAFSSFIMAKQAGFDLRFRQVDQALPDADLYLLPSLTGDRSLSLRFWNKLLERVEQGAVLYISINDAFLSSFQEVTGLEIHTQERRTSDAEIVLQGLKGKPRLTVNSPLKLNLIPKRAETLGHEPDNNPAFTCTPYGKGRVYFLSVPIEMSVCNMPGVFYGKHAQPFWRIYRHVAAESIGKRRIAQKDHPDLGITEHPLDDCRRVVVLINYGPEILRTSVKLAGGWRIGKILHGVKPENKTVSLRANEPAVWLISKQ